MRYEFEFEDRVVIPREVRALVKDTTPIPNRYICRLLISIATAGQTGTAWGTGFLIGNKYVLTAAHNITFKDGTGRVINATQIKVVPGCNHGLTNPLNWTPFGSVTIPASSCRVAKDYLDGMNEPGPYPNVKQRSNDFGLLILGEEIGKKKFNATKGRPMGFWGDVVNGGSTRLVATTAQEVKDQLVYLCGYPTDKCRDKPYTSSCDKVQRASTQWFLAAKAAVSPPQVIWYRGNTEGGQSGSPVWIRTPGGLLQCVGIHRGNSMGVYQEAVCITEAVLKQLGAWGLPV